LNATRDLSSRTVSLTRTDVAHEPQEGLGRSGFVERLRWFVIDAPAGILFII
jgi:hypothetical protein